MLLVTERQNFKTLDIDLKNGTEIARLINNEDKKVASAVAKIIPQIGEAIDKVADSLKKGGRMAYFGCGTSGRLGILDASELQPTFGLSPKIVQAYIAGGEQAIRHAVENAEDSEQLAEKDFNSFSPQIGDVVVGISASGNPKYLIKIMKLAQKKGCLTIAITSNSKARIHEFSDIVLNVSLGAEAIVGSSRMKSGTAQKMILNTLSTGVMVKMGKTYQNYMIDLEMTNEKLRLRAIRFIQEICKVDEKTASKVLAECKNVKVACVMLKKNCSALQAQQFLTEQNGILRKVIG